MIWTLTQVAIGGALGAVARFGTTHAFGRMLGTDFPYGTAFVNIFGSFVMGVLFVWLDTRGLTHHAPLLLAGLLGGFTTFSAFSLEAFRLWESGGVALAAVYVLGSVVLSIMALALGVMTLRAIA
jgi:fluoride exporter